MEESRIETYKDTWFYNIFGDGTLGFKGFHPGLGFIIWLDVANGEVHASELGLSSVCSTWCCV